MSNSETVLSFSNVSFSWNKTEPCLKNLSLNVLKGEKIFIYGKSGSGKTTFLNLVAGVLSPESGDIGVLSEKNFSKLSSAKKDIFRADHLGFVFQMFNLIPFLSVLDNILLPLNFSKVRHVKVLESYPDTGKAVKDIVTSLGLDSGELLARKVSDLSVGQQQRVATARALIGCPEIIIADEPTSALDSDSKELFVKLLFEQCEQNNQTLLMVSHDSSLAPLFNRSVSIDEIQERGK